MQIPNDTKFKSTLASMSADVRILLNRLLKVDIEARISYSELSELAGKDVRPMTTGYRILYRAKALAERDGVFFSPVKGDPEFHGIMRIQQAALVDSSGNVIHAIRRRANRQLNRLAAVAYDELDRDTQLTWNSRFAHLQAIRQFAAPKVMHEVEKVSAQSAERVDCKQVIEMFKK